ncbi:MAG: hypothetical protein ACQEQW_08505, partial [Bacteroidota bacterium]
PEYGTVEIGGFHPKFFSQNAPAKHLLPWAKNQALFNLEMVKHLPRLEWGDIDIKRIKSYKKDSVDYRVTVEYNNVGKLPTALRQAHLVKIVQEDKITVSFDSGLTEGEEPVIRILREDDDNGSSRYYRGSRGPASSLTIDAGYAEGESSNSSEFTIRVYKDVEVSGKASVSSTRGGILEKKEFVIK